MRPAQAKPSSRSAGEKFFSVVYLGLAIASFAAIFFIPNLNQQEIYASAVDLGEYVLHDSLHHSLYRNAARSGDTSPSLSALNHAVGILRQSKGEISDKKKVAEYLEFIKGELSRTQDLYEYVSSASFLNILSNSDIENLYHKLIELIEPGAGFRPEEHSVASVKSTYQALEAISHLGKIDSFKTTSKFETAIKFVRSSKFSKNETFGYKESSDSRSPSLSATFFAYLTLQKYSTIESSDFEGVVDYVSSCQVADGGFLDHSINEHEKYYETGTLENTAMAFYLIATLDSVDLSSLSLALDSREIYSAISFMRACVTVDTVKSTPDDYFGNIGATHAFVCLLNHFNAINVDIPRSVQVGLIGLALFFFSLGLYNFYKERLSRARGFNFHHIVSGSTVLLLVTAGTLKFFPDFTVIPLVFLTAFLLKVFYDNVEDLARTGDDTVLSIGLGGSFIYGIFLFGCFYISPHVMTQMSLYYVLAIWSGVAAFIAFVVARQFLANTKPQSFYYSAATLTWIMNTLLLYSLLYAR